ncbi:Cadherin-10 [Chelonia mydas]|uniref:Cadherin-10 n=1 Tax=Chelonia mydas TaxID=8469 RepID=M7BCI7_CHEMY|nr:Cadherin-10 [Chelonia mydas]
MGERQQSTHRSEDTTDKGDGSLKYILSGDGAGTLFIIDEKTGDIHATRRIDREEKAFYTLRAQAINRRTLRPVEPESEFVIKIHDINDNEPTFPEEIYTASVPEMSVVASQTINCEQLYFTNVDFFRFIMGKDEDPEFRTKLNLDTSGTSVVQVTATDADDPSYGNSARVIYSILQGQPYFSVEPETGIIRTALPNMNRENREQYQVVIQAKDMGGQMGGLSGTTTVNITLTDVNDNPPRFPQNTIHLRIPESSPVGTAIGSVKATDADTGKNAEMEYRIIDGDGTDVFDIVTQKDTQEGIITVRKPLDYETRRLYTLKVEAENTHVDPRFYYLGPFKDTTIVKISVEDVDEPPVFSRSSYLFEVHEDIETGSYLHTVRGTGQGYLVLAYLCSQFSLDRHTDLDRIFNIHSGNGSIYTSKPLDREISQWHNLSVIAAEINNPKDTTRVSVYVRILDVNDNAPQFAIFYDTFVCENARAGQLSKPYSLLFPDSDASHVTLMYCLLCMVCDGFSLDRHTDLDRIFNIHSGNGSIYTSKPLDREISQWHNLSVIAAEINNPKDTTRVSVYVRILDVNDNAPQFAIFYDTFVCENARAGQLIQTISAVDKDDPLGGQKFFFSLAAVNPNFTVQDNEDNTARILTRRNGFSRHEINTYFLPVVISDNDYPIQSSTGTLTIRVCTCDNRGNMQSCNAEALLLPAGLSTGALIAILLCIIILLVIVVLFAALKRQRKKEPLILSKEDIRDNIVSYNDEGGGEEDTQAFDIGTLRNPAAIEDKKLRRDIIPETLFIPRRTPSAPDNTDVRDFINQRLKEHDIDPSAPPYDSLATYAYEGNDSVAESLSSLESGTTEGDQNYDYLREWGPRFNKLAEMYGGGESDKDTS